MNPLFIIAIFMVLSCSSKRITNEVLNIENVTCITRDHEQYTFNKIEVNYKINNTEAKFRGESRFINEKPITVKIENNLRHLINYICKRSSSEQLKRYTILNSSLLNLLQKKLFRNNATFTSVIVSNPKKNIDL